MDALIASLTCNAHQLKPELSQDASSAYRVDNIHLTCGADDGTWAL